jgi:hypothetical protein
MANMELNFEQLLAAVRRLPHAQKTKLWQELDSEVDRNEIRRQAHEAFEAIWTANEGVSEDEVMADATAAVRAVRAERRARV